MGGVVDFVSDVGSDIVDFGGDLLGGVGDIPDQVFGTNIPSELKDPRLTGFEAPGLGANFLSPELLKVMRSPETQEALSGISDAYRTQAQDLAGLRPLVEPGFGRLTESGIRAVRDARRKTVGDLRQNLAKRRVLGSSFAADDIARTEAEFAKKESEVSSKAFIAEMAMSQNLINEQAQAQANQYLQTLNQLNIESQIASTMASGVSNILSSNAQLMGQMELGTGGRLFDTIGGVLGGIFG